MNSVIDNVNKENDKTIRGESIESLQEEHQTSFKKFISPKDNRKVNLPDENIYMETDYKNKLLPEHQELSITNNVSKSEQQSTIFLIVFILFIFISIAYTSNYMTNKYKKIEIPIETNI